jgi:hypothetical protein
MTMSSLDLSTPTRTVPSFAARPSLLSRLVTRYVDGWTWYVCDGGTPPAPEAAFPARRFDAFSTCPAPVVRRPCPPRFGLLFGTAAVR